MEATSLQGPGSAALGSGQGHGQALAGQQQMAASETAPQQVKVRAAQIHRQLPRAR